MNDLILTSNHQDIKLSVILVQTMCNTKKFLTTPFISIIFLICVLSAGCEDDQPVPVTDPPRPGFVHDQCLPLNPGSHWIYDVYLYNGSTENFLWQVMVRITGDTLIHHRWYSIFDKDPVFGGEGIIATDSSGCLVSTERVLYSSSNFSDTLYSSFDPTTGVYRATMMSLHEPVSVPAGNFSVTAALDISRSYDNQGNVTNERTGKSLYNRETGLVYRAIAPLGSGTEYRARLVAYHLE